MENLVSDVIENMNHEDVVCIKNELTKKGFECAVNSLNQCLRPVVGSHENKRGGITIVLENEQWLELAREHGYRV